MAYACPQCGATYTANETCEDRFYAGQIRELEDAAYYAVHQFSVTSYMLQHNGYSRDGWIAARRLLARFLAGLMPEEVRRQRRTTLGSGNRTFSITRGPRLKGVETIVWTRTLADVRLDAAERYRADVRAWAESVVRDSEALMQAVAPEGQGHPQGG